MIYRKLVGDYSAIEVADVFEEASMRLIALGFSELGYCRNRRRGAKKRALKQDGSIPSELQS